MSEEDCDDFEYINSGFEENASEGDEDLDSGDDVSLDDNDYEKELDWTSELPTETINPTSSQAGSATADYEFEPLRGLVDLLGLL